MCRHTARRRAWCVAAATAIVVRCASQIYSRQSSTKAWLLKAPSTAVKLYVQGRDVFVGRPKISGKWLCSTILPTSLVNLPCLLEKHGVDDHYYTCLLWQIAYRKLVFAVTFMTSFYVKTFLAAGKVVQVFPDVFPTKYGWSRD